MQVTPPAVFTRQLEQSVTLAGQSKQESKLEEGTSEFTHFVQATEPSVILVAQVPQFAILVAQSTHESPSEEGTFELLQARHVTVLPLWEQTEQSVMLELHT